MSRDEIRSFDPTIRHLADRWSDAGILLKGFSLLARGRPVGISELAASSDVPVEDVARALEVGRCELDKHGSLVDLYGMTLSPTLHRLDIDGRKLFSCCALWAHVIPKLVDQTVRVESIDPITRRAVRLSISPDGVESADPIGSAATMAIASREQIREDVGSAFCTLVKHFTSTESAERFTAESPTSHVVDVDTLDASANELHRAIWAVSS